MNATVTLSLGEIDALRNEIIEAKAKLAESEAHQKTMQVNVTENWQAMEIGTERVYDYDTMRRDRTSYRHTMRSVAKSITNWYNLDDVMGLLRKTAEDTVASQVTDLKATIGRRDADVTALQLSNDAKSNEIRGLVLQVAELKKIEVEKTELERYKNLAKDKEELIQKALREIDKLREQLAKKGFWSRLFD